MTKHTSGSAISAASTPSPTTRTLLRIGGAVLRGGGPVKRCAATTRDLASGAVDLQTLRLITAYRGRRETELGVGATFGRYCEVLEPETVAIGDCLRVG